MKRVPLRLRVAASFAVAMAVVLAGTGIFLYARLGNDLARSLDENLRLRAQDLSALVREQRGSLLGDSGGRFIERGESFAQLLDRRGTVLDATARLRQKPLLPASELRSLRGPRFLNLPSIPGLDEPARLLASPLGKRVLVVGATRENRAEALRSLRTTLLFALPVALLLATIVGYLLAGASLRVVESMRRRAAAISADRPGERLPVPPTGDELQRLGGTLNEMLERLEAALERERDFVAEAGHELRTPLALLRAELDFALHHAESEEELRAALREASAETDRLVQLSGDLLVIASSDRGKLPLKTEPLRIRELLESVRNRFLSRAIEENRSLEVEAAPGLTVVGDRLRLEQALGNLVDNALRHGEGPVSLEARSGEGHAELHVFDEGQGFQIGFLPRAFQRFSRPEEGRTTGGAGLGLAIVDAIARAHGGRAQAANGSGRGTDVWLELPSVSPTAGARDPGSRARARAPRPSR